MRAVVMCPECHEEHPIIAGRIACPKPAKFDPNRPRCGFISFPLEEAKQK